MSWDVEPIVFGDVVERDLGGLRTKVSLDMHRGLVIKSPVLTGRFRSSWAMSYDAPVDVSRITTAGRVISQGASALARKATRPYETVWINNAMPYGGKLEYGSSKQAPNGVLRITVASIRLKYEL